MWAGCVSEVAPAKVYSTFFMLFVRDTYVVILKPLGIAKLVLITSYLWKYDFSRSYHYSAFVMLYPESRNTELATNVISKNNSIR